MAPTLFKESAVFALRHKRLALILWFLSLLTALPVFRAIHSSLRSYFEHSIVPDIWLSEFKLHYLMEWVGDNPPAVSAILVLLATLILIYVLLTVFVTGGIVGLAGDELRPSTDGSRSGQLVRFAHYGALYWGRILRIFLLTLVAILVAVLLGMAGTIGRIMAGFWIFTWVVVTDLAKGLLALKGSRRIIPLILESVRLLVASRGHIVLLYLMYAGLFMLGATVYFWVDSLITPNTTALILLMIVWQQLFVWLRQMLRVQTLSGGLLAAAQYRTTTATAEDVGHA